MKSALSLSFLLLLCGCSTLGLRFEDHPDSHAPVPEDMARITIYRLDAHHYGGRSARLWADGREAGMLPASGFLSLGIAPGTHVIVADLWDANGYCHVVVEAEAGQTYYLEVAPRMENQFNAMINSLIPHGGAGVALGSVLVNALLQLTSPISPCGGAFSIHAVDATIAMSSLPGLRHAE